MPYYDGSRSVMDDLRACVDARKASYVQYAKAEHNRQLAASYRPVAPLNAATYADRAAMFETQEISLTISADRCSNAAFDMLTMGAYDDKWDIKRTV